METVRGIKREIDGVKFDVGDGVQECGVAFRCAELAARDVLGRYQSRFLRTAGRIEGGLRGVRVIGERDVALLPVAVQGFKGDDFCVGIGELEAVVGAFGEGNVHG